jgi:hypothetical protein
MSLEGSQSNGMAVRNRQGSSDLVYRFNQTGIPGAVNGAVRDSNFVDKFAGSTERWSTRIALGKALDYGIDSFAKSGHINPQKVIPEVVKPLAPVVSPIAANAVSYRQLLNLGKSAEQLTQERLINPNAFEYHTVALKDVLKKGQYAEAVRNNFSRFLTPSAATQGKGLWTHISTNPGGFLKNTVINDNFRRMADTLTTGKNIGSGIASGLGLAFLGYDVVSTTADAYHDGKSKEDGSYTSKLKTMGQTATTFVTKGAKSLACWEISTIGYAVGASLMPVGRVLPIVGGIVTGALAAVAANKVLSTVIKDPPRRSSSTS